MTKKTQRKAAEIKNTISLRRHNKNKNSEEIPSKRKINLRRTLVSSSESENNISTNNSGTNNSNSIFKNKTKGKKTKKEIEIELKSNNSNKNDSDVSSYISTESESHENTVILDENKHFDEIHVKKYDTYKIGKFKNKNMKSYGKTLDIYNLKYMEISSRFSVRPKKKLCEFTGLPAQFRCPYTRLYYYDSSVYKHLRHLSSDVITYIYKTKEIGKNFNPFNNSK